ncbi:hypothetical protein K488DRAFT_69356 [Vararia minispora EC-137]|uniref:Uncharacterized protein n=1 Tax=Vararia minispora EC-137 TaxID=1314806 RepID=A0ACB8QR73_9AGAM|nr:hypothetical protein K488DRAFT_69356 [Vararia minispora EC-137]
MVHEFKPSGSFSGSADPGSSHSGVRFPDSARSSQTNSFSKASSLGIGPPPRRSPVGQDGASSSGYRDDDRRRRVRSAQGVSFGQTYYDMAQSPSASRRWSPMVDRLARGSNEVRPRRVTMSARPLAGVDEFEPSVFSDEYDLYPKILEEVQHALKLQMRREARQRAPIAEALSISSVSSGPSSSLHVSKIPTPAFPRIARASTESELDFSPAVGFHRLHPVPISFNDGHTLDWGWSEPPEEPSERKWPIPIPKRKFLLAERLTSIKGSAAPQTFRKADITRNQLERRYRALNATLEADKEPLNPAQVVSWYSSLDPIMRASLDDAEPFTWLRHLRDRHLARTGCRFPWHISALLVEEFLEQGTRQPITPPIPEDSVAPMSPLYPSSPATHSFESASDISPHKHLAASLSRRPSFDGNVSFEPYVDTSGRRSGGEDSRLSIEGPPRYRQRPSLLESPRSSIYSASGQLELAPASPSSSRGRIRGLAMLSRQHDSDEPSSPHHSVSEDSDGGKKKKKRSIRLRPAGLDLISRAQPLPEVLSGDERGMSHEGSAELGIMTPSPSQLLTAKAEGGSESIPTSPTGDVTATEPHLPSRMGSVRVLKLRGYRTSLPSLRPASTADDHLRVDVEDDAVREEYEQRKDLINQNHMNRMALQRVAHVVKEYHKLLSRFANSLGVPYTPLSEEVLDALSHDPAVIVNHTSKLKGYHAVENQAETLWRCLRENGIGVMQLETFGSVMQPSVEILRHTLAEVEEMMPTIEEKTKMVSDALTRVKKLHAAVKMEYNEAVAHTSAVYPEMSRIVALEDSYKNRYQQVWDIGMDFATFMLDAVVPFWRNYGKVIGIDIQDFLIVPLYRNEFTGEAKRYPITKLPQRSLRHWVALSFIFISNILIWYYQSRGVWVSCKRYYVPLLASPTFWAVTLPLYCVFVGIQVFFVFLEAAGLSLHLVVIFWWLGWWAGIFT